MAGLVTCDAAIPARFSLGAHLATSDQCPGRSIAWVHVGRANGEDYGQQQVSHVILPLTEAAAAREMSLAIYKYPGKRARTGFPAVQFMKRRAALGTM